MDQAGEGKETMMDAKNEGAIGPEACCRTYPYIGCAGIAVFIGGFLLLFYSWWMWVALNNIASPHVVTVTGKDEFQVDVAVQVPVDEFCMNLSCYKPFGGNGTQCGMRLPGHEAHRDFVRGMVGSYDASEAYGDSWMKFEPMRGVADAVAVIAILWCIVVCVVLAIRPKLGPDIRCFYVLAAVCVVAWLPLFIASQSLTDQFDHVHRALFRAFPRRDLLDGLSPSKAPCIEDTGGGCVITLAAASVLMSLQQLAGVIRAERLQASDVMVDPRDPLRYEVQNVSGVVLGLNVALSLMVALTLAWLLSVWLGLFDSSRAGAYESVQTAEDAGDEGTEDEGREEAEQVATTQDAQYRTVRNDDRGQGRPPN